MSAFKTMRSKLPGWWVVGDFLGWWIAELRAGLADVAEILRIRGSTRLFVYVERERLQIKQMRGSKTHDLAILTRDSAGQWPVIVDVGDSSREIPDLTGATLTAVLPASDVLIRKLVLPAAAERSLDRVAAIRAVQEFPLPPSLIYFDYCVAERLRETKQIVVHLRGVRRAQADELLKWASSVGGRLDRICFKTSDGETSGNFLPRASWGGVTRFSGIERGFGVAALILLAATVLVVGAQWWFERQQVEAEVAKLHTHAQQVRVKWKQIETESAPATELIKIMSAPDATAVLGDLSATLPTDTWVSQIEIRSPSAEVTSVSLSALAPAATALVDELAKSSHFQHVHLVYAASDTLSSHGDRVQLSAEWIVPKDASRSLTTSRPPQGNSR